MAAITFYTNPMSRGRIARWMLEETGAPYETVFLHYGPDMRTPAYLDINPMGKVPAIRHGGAVVTEVAAICAYLADAFPQAGLAPPVHARADYYRWLMFAAGPWEQASVNRALGVEVPADKQGMAGYGDFDRTLTVLMNAIPRKGYICGDQFTAADVYFGAQVAWGAQFGSIPQTPDVLAYIERLQSRPAYKRGVEKDDAAIAEFGPSL